MTFQLYDSRHGTCAGPFKGQDCILGLLTVKRHLQIFVVIWLHSLHKICNKNKSYFAMEALLFARQLAFYA